MRIYENLLSSAYNQGIKVIEADLGIDKPFGKCIGNIIIVNSRVTICERVSVLSEELGHFNLTVGDITNQTNTNNKKQELIARRWSYEKLVTPEIIINSILSGIDNLYDLAEKLDITEEILIECINHYKRKYGIYYVGKTHLLTFEPLNVNRFFKIKCANKGVIIYGLQHNL